MICEFCIYTPPFQTDAIHYQYSARVGVQLPIDNWKYTGYHSLEMSGKDLDVYEDDDFFDFCKNELNASDQRYGI